MKVRLGIPTLHSERLRLDPFTLEDAPTVRLLAGDPEVARTTLNVPHPYPEGAAEAWITTHPIQFKEHSNVVFAIRLDSGELIGSINLGLDTRFHRGTLGYWIGVPYWNQGYCTEAVHAVLAYGFEELRLNRIYAYHESGNPASGRVMQKVGMTREGCLRQHYYKDGKYLDSVEYGILRSEWVAQRQAQA